MELAMQQCREDKFSQQEHQVQSPWGSKAGLHGSKSTEEARAAAAEGVGRAMSLRETGGRVRQGLEGWVMDCEFHYVWGGTHWRVSIGQWPDQNCILIGYLGCWEETAWMRQDWTWGDEGEAVAASRGQMTTGGTGNGNGRRGGPWTHTFSTLLLGFYIGAGTRDTAANKTEMPALLECRVKREEKG